MNKSICGKSFGLINLISPKFLLLICALYNSSNFFLFLGISDLPFENQWYVPGGDSYIAKIFSDAGGDYIWKDNKSIGSLHIDAESVLLKAQNADYWRVINSYDTPFTYENLAKENDLYPLFKAFKEKQLLVCNVRECGYFEQSQYEPDILLADFIYHFHPELLTNEWENYTPKYFKRLIK